VRAELRQAIAERDEAAGRLDRLRAHGGLHSDGELRSAADELMVARRERFFNERTMGDKDLPRKMRRDARHKSADCVLRERLAEEKVAPLLRTEDRRLADALELAEHQVGTWADKDAERSRWFDEHPDVPGRFRELGTAISGIDAEMDAERRAVVRELYPEPERPRTPERSMSYDHDRGIDPPDLGYDLGL
jgi:hypothetical protein